MDFKRLREYVPDDWKGLDEEPPPSVLVSALTGKTWPRISVIRDVMNRLRVELHAALGEGLEGDPNRKPPSPLENPDDDRPALVIRRKKGR